MKGSIAILSFVFAQMGFAAPTMYGLIGKEVRSITQHEDVNASGTTGVTDVDGFESRLGAKGTYELKGSSVDYVLEFGYNSSLDNNTGADTRIRPRLAYIQFNESWGTVVFGSNWQLDFLYQWKIDPLRTTGAQQAGLEYAGLNGFRSAYLGMRSTYWDDMLRYSTQEYFGGFKYHLTFDRQDVTAVDTASNRIRFITHHFTWDKDAISAAFWLRSREASNTQIAAPASFSQDKVTGLTVRYAKNGISVGLGYVMTENGEFTNSDGDEEILKFTSTNLGIGYTMGKNTYGLNYGLTDFGNQMEDNIAAATDPQGTQSSIGIGWVHQYTKEVSARLFYTSYTRTLPSLATPLLANGEDSIGASVLGFGTEVKF